VIGAFVKVCGIALSAPIDMCSGAIGECLLKESAMLEPSDQYVMRIDGDTLGVGRSRRAARTGGPVTLDNRCVLLFAGTASRGLGCWTASSLKSSINGILILDTAFLNTHFRVCSSDVNRYRGFRPLMAMAYATTRDGCIYSTGSVAAIDGLAAITLGDISTVGPPQL
jgi:hypothetical protein